ncbi:XRE family transcriptional regulator [Candidatus Poriferisodalis sp.]|uniref:XRE family transcriptional regulator n=1 Tax=Candidatus Poriferisodalis sp. TaxID=3101277 RepID=UPI003B0166F3
MNDSERLEQVPVDTASVDDVQPDAWERDLSMGPVFERIRSHPEARAHYEAIRGQIEQHQATLAQVRKARTLTQQHIAEQLQMDQSEVSRLEHRSNMLLSTLRSFVRATGGDLHLIATFPDAEPVHLLVGTESDEPTSPASATN